ncbi:rhomboid family intramembrane serine protease [Draconibacterium sp. IB214405]|uniref:rhomboid family intramembrane serine protease n=1 Tax=Draconibacterium sp. IB214405 TaxID=3097352 RepID=UPI002A150BF6|nr:rhomboid family intramembrane serine protease [Draconibacterium sp. IB214405]MDX8341506.1 rhomboid family intramembrane serine protease [Draconibacterium sp. IB214405]
MRYRPMLNMPPVVKNLILANVVFYLITIVLKQTGTDLYPILGLHFPLSEKFRLHQFFTYMFMHDSHGIGHIFFNMFALYMFGRVLEGVWGPKRFLTFYLVTGIGAAVLHMAVTYFEYQSLIGKMSADQIAYVKEVGYQIWSEGKNFSDPLAGKLNAILNTPTVGASGAVFGILLGFGMLFPNTELMLLFPPIPIKAKYFVIGYGALELFFGVSGIQGSVAHFAHLGGMLFGYFMIKYWNKTSNRFY